MPGNSMWTAEELLFVISAVADPANKALSKTALARALVLQWPKGGNDRSEGAVTDAIERARLGSLQIQLDRVRAAAVKRAALAAAAAEQRIKTGPTPSDDELFAFLKDKPRALLDVCNAFNVSPDHAQARLRAMEEAGYNLEELDAELSTVQITTQTRTVAPTPARVLSDEAGMVVSLGFISDKHAGSVFSQPSAVAACARIMHEEYGVRHFFDPGDTTAGLYVYRGQAEELIPQARPRGREYASRATRVQVELADAYTPKLEGAEWWMLGGNHDWNHVVTCGLDPVRMLCDRRPDCHYLGYDVGGLWITDKVYLRLWHPGGGRAYAKSYRLQKGQESIAVEALLEAIKGEQTPATSILMAGHMHEAIWLCTLPILAGFAGCFEGRTSLSKRKGGGVDLGGTVLRLLLTDGGRIQRVEHTFLAYDEIENDWRNWPTPEQPTPNYDPDDDLRTLYQFAGRPPGERFPADDPRRGSEYVGGH